LRIGARPQNHLKKKTPQCILILHNNNKDLDMTTTLDSIPSAATPLVCGIIMPISTTNDLSSEHWTEVKTIIQDAVDSIPEPKFSARLVSDADDVGVIHKRIVQGVYSSDIVVCDVSARNPNVMFELGMRLAFDKPTVIIKDDKTDYAFDTSIIEHIAYPRDLRFSRIVAFKRQLADKVLATYKAATTNSEHSTFLKNFGTFKVAKLDQAIGSPDQLLLDMVTDVHREITRLRRASSLNLDSYTARQEEGRARILGELLKLRIDSVNVPIELNPDLINLLEATVPASKYFKSKSAFRETVEEVYEMMTSKTS
jgi:nucleoside 2-deoxyribosyltransferase